MKFGLLAVLVGVAVGGVAYWQYHKRESVTAELQRAGVELHASCPALADEEEWDFYLENHGSVTTQLCAEKREEQWNTFHTFLYIGLGIGVIGLLFVIGGGIAYLTLPTASSLERKRLEAVMQSRGIKDLSELEHRHDERPEP